MSAPHKATLNVVRPTASLAPTLLARKGAASPAMRSASGKLGTPGDLDDMADSQAALGWNDTGEDREHPRQRASHNGRRAAFTLRLDPHRHLRLRLASALQDRSAQMLVTEALDRFLDEIPQLEALAPVVSSTSDKS